MDKTLAVLVMEEISMVKSSLTVRKTLLNKFTKSPNINTRICGMLPPPLNFIKFILNLNKLI